MGQLLNRFKDIINSVLDDVEDVRPWKEKEPKEDFDKHLDDVLRYQAYIESLSNKSNYQEACNYAKSKIDDQWHIDINKTLTLGESYHILDINMTSTNDQIKTAYIQKIKEYHPDKVASLGAELKTLAESKTQQINEAYQTICRSRGL